MNVTEQNSAQPVSLLNLPGMEYTVSLVKGKYKLPIICCLMLHGPTRYNELKRRVAAATYRSLSNALKEMEEDGLVIRQEYYEIPPRVEYSLSDRGKSLIPVLQSLGAWGGLYRPPGEAGSD